MRHIFANKPHCFLEEVVKHHITDTSGFNHFVYSFREEEIVMPVKLLSLHHITDTLQIMNTFMFPK